MGESTTIGWTKHTYNPWWGCERVSPGCNHCYAETFAKRTGNLVWGKNADRRRFGDKHWQAPVKWNRQAEDAGEPQFVFCASMADVFEDRDDHGDDRERLWELVEATPWLTWQLLTKRPENVVRMVPSRWTCEDWPANVWIGTTVEDQQRADARVPALLTIPAPVRFLSCEPLLGPVDLDGLWGYPGSAEGDDLDRWPIHWVIVGGESGPKHRPLDLDHARSLRDQCAMANVAFFFKQHGGQFPASGGDLLDGRIWKERPPAHHPEERAHRRVKR